VTNPARSELAPQSLHLGRAEPGLLGPAADHLVHRMPGHRLAPDGTGGVDEDDEVAYAVLPVWPRPSVVRGRGPLPDRAGRTMPADQRQRRAHLRHNRRHRPFHLRVRQARAPAVGALLGIRSLNGPPGHPLCGVEGHLF